MIRTDRLIPDVYYGESRDFQVLGRSFDLMANLVKMNIDSQERNSIDPSADANTLSLIALTVGFMPKHIYDNGDLAAVCSSFRELLMIKGTKQSIETALKILLSRQNISVDYDLVTLDADAETNVKMHNVIIMLPEGVSDVILLEDLLEYILPAGWTYRFVSVNAGSSISNAVSTISASSTTEHTDVDSTKPGVLISTGDRSNADDPEPRSYLSAVSGRISSEASSNIANSEDGGE